MSDLSSANLKLGHSIKEKAKELGFAACGFAKAESVDEVSEEQLKNWLKKDCHGKMGYMANHMDMRLDPRILVPGAKSVISLAFNYHQKGFQPAGAFYKISQYAAGIDYHHVLKKKLYTLLEFIQHQTEAGTARVFTDSAPVLERYWAQKAGLGTFGKNSCLILPRKGSYFFLAEIILDIELPYDNPIDQDLCGACTRCMTACPTGAIIEPGKIDATKCISYLTIELKEAVPENFTGKMNQYIFGCDICQNVCPHNTRFAEPASEDDFDALPSIAHWEKQDWENMDKATFRRSFIKTRSPLARVKFEKLMKNITMAAEGQHPSRLA